MIEIVYGLEDYCVPGRTRTLLQFIEEVRQRADMVNSTFVTDAEITRYINQSIAELYDLLVECAGQEFYAAQGDVAVVAGTASYTLAELAQCNPGFYLLLGVDWTEGGSTRPLRPYNFDERNNVVGMMRYRLAGTVDSTGLYVPTIFFSPTPKTSGTATIHFVPHAPVLEDDTDTWDGFNGWEEYVVVDSAIKCLEKEESDTQALQLRLSRMQQRIRGMAVSRDVGFPEKVRDSYAALHDDIDRYEY